MDLFDKNIQTISKNEYHYIAPFLEEMSTYTLVAADLGEEFFTDKQERIYQVKDVFDEDYTPNNMVSELYFILGINGVEEIKQLVYLANPGSVFVIVEPHGEFFKNTINNKDLSLFNQNNIILIVEAIDNIASHLESILTSPAVLLSGNIRFYASYFYRIYALEEYKHFVKKVGEAIKYKFFTFGNSIQDSLVGICQNGINIKQLRNSKDLMKMRGCFKDIPGIVVAAGPSLDKNIEKLRCCKGKAVIFAVDTIVERLLKKGIVPDFVCSIERDMEVYEFFYKNKGIPEDVSLIAPLVIRPEIFEGYRGKIVIPLRKNVREYLWWNQLLQLPEEVFVDLGSSCAHVAFSMGAYMGCSPMVLVGQDLSYGEADGKSHSEGTIYDENNFNLYDQEQFLIEGYNGGKVATNKTWFDFKTWFEMMIQDKSLFVINATEGGAKIAYTKQMSLGNVVEKYCKNETDVKKVLSNIPLYKIEWGQVAKRLLKEKEMLIELAKEFQKAAQRLRNIKIKKDDSQEKLLKCLEKLKKTDGLLQKIYSNQLLFHVLQVAILSANIQFHRIPGELTISSVQKNVELQKEFLNTLVIVTAEVIKIISDIEPTFNKKEDELWQKN